MSKQMRIKKLESQQTPTKPGTKKMVLRALRWFWRKVMITPSTATRKATGSCQDTTVYTTSYSVYVIFFVGCLDDTNKYGLSESLCDKTIFFFEDIGPGMG